MHAKISGALESDFYIKSCDGLQAKSISLLFDSSVRAGFDIIDQSPNVWRVQREFLPTSSAAVSHEDSKPT